MQHRQGVAAVQGRLRSIWDDALIFTPEHAEIPTPNDDTPGSMIQADLRAEPLVFCVPEVKKAQVRIGA